MNVPEAAWDEESAACERALEALVFGETIDPRDPKAIERWLDASGVQGHSRSALTEQLRQRLPVYRKLVHERVSEALCTMLPRTSELLGERWVGLVESFLEEHGPRTPILRDILTEWNGWFRGHFARDPQEPVWLVDFMAYESLQIEVAALGTVHTGDAPEHLDAQTRFMRHPAARLSCLDYAVQREPITLSSPPERMPTYLLVYCDEQYEQHRLELGPFTVSLWKTLHESLPLGQAVSASLAQGSPDAVVPSLQAVSALLADWCQRGLIVTPLTS
jgi:hypothetical protein